MESKKVYDFRGDAPKLSADDEAYEVPENVNY